MIIIIKKNQFNSENKPFFGRLSFFTVHIIELIIRFLKISLKTFSNVFFLTHVVVSPNIPSKALKDN